MARSISPASEAGPKCPICEEPRSAEYKPFCSKRCADRDLHRWLSGSYAIPATEAEPPTDDDLEN